MCATYTHPMAMRVSRNTKYMECAYDLSKHSLGMTALISPFVGNVGALGSRGLYGLTQYRLPLALASLAVDVGTISFFELDGFAVDLPPFPMVSFGLVSLGEG